MSNTLDLTSPTPSATGSPSTRRSTRPKRSSDTPKPRLASSLGDTELSGSRRTAPNAGDTGPRQKLITPSNPRPWMHPQELIYVGEVDFPQSGLIQYLCAKAFSIPPRETNSAIPLFQVTIRDGTAISLPRGYRVPLMFVAKFQWDSLKLVLTAADPLKEWDEYKFDIIHLTRLCERLFNDATEAQKQAVTDGSKGIDRLWRCPTFDRVLTRFYHRWFVSREWSIRKFWEEFDDDEYDGDVLKHDWARWAVKGHKGFTLTRDQIVNGISAQQFMHGLTKNSNGTWVWDESLPLSTTQNSIVESSSSLDDLMVVDNELNPINTTIATLEEIFGDRMGIGTPSHNTIEVKKERLDFSQLFPFHKLHTPSSDSGTSASTPTIVVPTNLESVPASVTVVPTVVAPILPNNDSTNVANKSIESAEPSSSSTQEKITTVEVPKSPSPVRMMSTARKTAPSVPFVSLRTMARPAAPSSGTSSSIPPVVVPTNLPSNSVAAIVAADSIKHSTNITKKPLEAAAAPKIFKRCILARKSMPPSFYARQQREEEKRRHEEEKIARKRKKSDKSGRVESMPAPRKSDSSAPSPKRRKTGDFSSSRDLSTFRWRDSSDDDSSDDEGSSSDGDDDSKDGDYRGPRSSKSKPDKMNTKSSSSTRHDQASNGPPPSVNVRPKRQKAPKQTTTTSRPSDRLSTKSHQPPVVTGIHKSPAVAESHMPRSHKLPVAAGSHSASVVAGSHKPPVAAGSHKPSVVAESHKPPVVATEFRVVSTFTQTQDSSLRVDDASSTSVTTSTTNGPVPVVTGSSSPVTAVALASSEPPAATAAQSKMPLSSSAEGLSSSASIPSSTSIVPPTTNGPEVPPDQVTGSLPSAPPVTAVTIASPEPPGTAAATVAPLVMEYSDEALNEMLNDVRRKLGLPYHTHFPPRTSNGPKVPPDQVTGSLPSAPPVTTVTMANTEPPGAATATVAQSEMADAKRLLTAATHKTPLTSERVSTKEGAPSPSPSPSPALPAPQDGVPTFGDLSNSNNQDVSAAVTSSPSHPQETVTDPSALPSNVSEMVLDGSVVKEHTVDVAPDRRFSDWEHFRLFFNVEASQRSVYEHVTSDVREPSANEEPSTSAVVPETLLHTEDVQPRDFSSAPLPVSKQDDQMDIDEPVERREDLQGMLASLFSDPIRAHVRRAALILREALRDQKTQSGSVCADGEESFSPNVLHSLFASNVDPDDDDNVPFTWEVHWELVVKCSSLLSKYATVYEGRELQERLVELDERVRRELSKEIIVRRFPTTSLARAGFQPPAREVGKEDASADHSDLANQEKEVVGDEPVEKVDGIVQDPATDEAVEKADAIMQDPATDTVSSQFLSPEATMVDLSSVPLTTGATDSDSLQKELVSGTMPDTTRLLTSIMRNLADVLDCKGGGDIKGKGRAVDVVSAGTAGPPQESVLATALLNEFEFMKEEMRKSQERSREEVKEQMKAMEDRYRRETEILRQSHREEMDSFMESFREGTKRREKEIVEGEGRLPSLEMMELRRRVTTLERQAGTLTFQAGSSSRAACENESDITIIRRAPFHPLGHLFDYEDGPSPNGVTSVSKPGTPIQCDIDSIPLPIKSQRKFQSMHRIVNS